MKEIAATLCILGRQPDLGLAELEALYGANHINPLLGAALLDLPAEDINFTRLGGTIKAAKIIDVLPHTDWPKLLSYLKSEIPKLLEYLPPGTFTLGLSTYGVRV